MWIQNEGSSRCGVFSAFRSLKKTYWTDLVQLSHSGFKKGFTDETADTIGVNVA
jgi:hypothetical protein